MGRGKKTAALITFILGSNAAHAQDISDAGLSRWGVSMERFEFRDGEDEDALATEGGAFYSTDELKLRHELEAGYEIKEDVLAVPKNQLVLQKTDLGVL